MCVILWRLSIRTGLRGTYYDEVREGINMETNQAEWRSAENTVAEGPSQDFIRAVAELLETDPDDILAELGYAHAEEAGVATSEL